MTPGPGIAYLDGARLNRALKAGITRLLADCGHLNQINVYPVADGDTGTNMALTVGPIAAALDAQQTPHAGRLLNIVADAALDGARGNSGAILAQFLQGLADACTDAEKIDAATLGGAFATGDSYSRAALDRPEEGTILSVISSVRKAIEQSVGNGERDLGPILNEALARGRLALEATRDGLPAMRKAGVEDAGAAGFIDLLEGIVEFINHGSLRNIPDPARSDIDLEVMGAAAASPTEIEFAYCTECMLTGEQLDRRIIREALAGHGNSMVLAGTRRKMKVHIHTNDPERVFQLAGQFGSVSGPKADDMRQQTRTIQHFRDEIVIVTDSAADIPEEALEDYNIYVVPLRVSFGTQSYLDKVSLSSAEFFHALKTRPEFPKTSQPAPGDYRRTFEFLVTHFRHVVVISLAEKLSGTYQAAVAAASRVDGPGTITVINSRNVSLGQGLLAIRAGEYVKSGYSVERLVEAINRDIGRTRSYGMVADLRYAERGGRMSARLRRLADWLGIQPIFSVTKVGKVAPATVIRRSADRIAKLARYIERQADRKHQYRVAVGHGDCENEAVELCRLLEASLPIHGPVQLTELGTALGAHTGPGTLVVALQED